MEHVIIIGIALAIGVPFFIWFDRRATKKWKQKLQNIQEASFRGHHVEGLPIGQGNICKVLGYKNQPIVIKSGKQEFTIPVERIVNFGYFTETQIAEKSKSVVGRAVIGGVLLGGLGAVVGAASGIGTKKVAKEEAYFVINYLNKEGETAVISFKTPFRTDVAAEEFSVLYGIKQFDQQNESVVL